MKRSLDGMNQIHGCEIKNDREERCMNIIDFIPTGKENRISFEALRGAMGIKDPRRLRGLIEKARQNGEPICNDGNGYYRAEHQEELDRSIKRMGSRISKQIATKKGLEKAREGLPSVHM